MSQHDYVIDNQDGASFRADINSVLSAIASCNSGATAPGSTYAYQIWHDTTTGIIKQRDATNSSWLNLADVLLAGKTINGLLTYTNQLKQSTSQATTSGTVVDFTSIPSWVNRITVMFRSVSTSGTAALLLRVGSGSFLSSGYTAAATICGNATVTAQDTTGFNVTQSGAASDSYSGSVTLCHVGGNIWTSNGALTRTQGGLTISAGSISVGGVLDRIRITNTGSDTFDAGSANILYE